MEFILRGYHVDDPTWFYLSFLLIIAVYFKFNRFWSLRNVDLGLLLLISPGVLFVTRQPTAGYVWLFVATAALLVRVLSDSLFTRRPRLEQNMNVHGLTFLLAATFAFLMTKVMTESPPQATVDSVRHASRLLAREDTSQAAVPATPPAEASPGSSLIVAPVVGISKVVTAQESKRATAPPDTPIDAEEATLLELTGLNDPDVVAARTLAILAHLAVVLGLIVAGRRLFNDAPGGIAMAALYLLLPCTAVDVGKVIHVLPAALIVWALVAYRRPVVSGALMGLACSTLFFPFFLLPLWGAFYGRRGGLRFGLSVAATTVVIVGSLALTSADWQSFLRQTLGGYTEWAQLQFRSAEESGGFWRQFETEAAYRIPVLVSFTVMLTVLTIWPRQRNLGHLMSQSAAIVLGTQFWYPQQGGVYVLWYLPLLLLVVFRPILSQQVAPEIMPLAWLWRRQSMDISTKGPQLVASSGGASALRYR
jgi:hypothetical protein